MTPDSTPREALYIETGLLDIETIAASRRLNMKARLNREKSEMMKKVLSNPKCLWEEHTNAVTREYKINKDQLVGSKYQTKSNIKKAIKDQFKININQAAQGKSKMNYFLEGHDDWEPLKRADYMNKLTRKQTSLIFKARTRMLKFKGNYKNGYPNLTCRICKQAEETQTHVLEECPVLHPDDNNKIPKHQVFSGDAGTLRNTADKIAELLEKMSELLH